MQIRLHAFEPFSRANGPGLRAVVWVQGCTLGCPGCFNPTSHSLHAGYVADSNDIAASIAALSPRIEGVTVSGGEPLQQPDAVFDLLTRLDSTGLGRILFSGYTFDEIVSLPLGPVILAQVDLLIAGRYDRSRPLREGLRSSSNQQHHFLTDRYSAADIAAVARRELIVKTDGTVVASGIVRWQP